MEDGAHLPADGLPAWLAGPGTRLLAEQRRTFVALALLLAASVALRLAQTVNNDVAWYFFSAQKLLEGGTLYRDIGFDVNPPMIFYLNLPAAYVTQLTGIFGVHVYILYVFGLILLCLGLSWRMLDWIPGLSPPARRGLLLAIFVMLVIVPAGDFGQREHLMVTLITPYLSVILLRGHGQGCIRSLAALAGVLGAVGFSIKPHFLVLPVALEIYLLWHHRSWRLLFRTETLWLAVTGFLYAISLVLLTPDYVTRVIPFVLELYNGAYRNSLTFVLERKEAVLVPMALLLYPALRPRLSFKPASDLFLIAATCFFTVYLIQMKGWNYQIYPTTAMLFMFLAAALVGLLESGGTGRMPRAGPAPMAAAALAAALLVQPLLNPGNAAPMNDLFGQTVRRHAAGSAIYVFSSNTWTGFPLVVYAGVEWSSRFPALWTLPGLQIRQAAIEGRPDDESIRTLKEIETFTIEAVVADLNARPPALVVVDARSEKPWYPAPFDFIEYFSQDPRFVAFWRHYRRVDESHGFVVYRRCPSPCPPDEAHQVEG